MRPATKGAARSRSSRRPSPPLRSGTRPFRALTHSRVAVRLQGIEAINPDHDLVNYNKTLGAGMPLPMPGFEEYGAKPTIEVVVNAYAPCSPAPLLPFSPFLR
jgi:hypothetical protein